MLGWPRVEKPGNYARLNPPLHSGSIMTPDPENSQVDKTALRFQFLSLLYEISSVETPTHALAQDSEASVLSHALRGWHVVMGVQFGHLFGDDNRLSTAQVVLERLAKSLYSMYAMAFAKECGVGPAMLMIIVSDCHGH